MNVFIITRLVLDFRMNLSVMLGVHKSIVDGGNMMGHANDLSHMLISSGLHISMMSFGGLMLNYWN